MDSSLQEKGYVILDLAGVEYLESIQKIISQHFPYPIQELHKYNDYTQKDRCMWIKKAKDEVAESKYLYLFLQENLDVFVDLLGPDLDMQSNPHLRVTRPNLEDDAIGWHRDTFYGNMFWECNLWLPIFPLAKDSGLLVLEGLHLKPSSNIRAIEEKNAFKNAVQRGSLENELGYPYMPKTDDTILHRNEKDALLLSPKVGQAIFFFGYLPHCPYNKSDKTRASFDLRIKAMLAASNTKDEYYTKLSRGSVGKVVDQMIGLNL